MFIYAIMYKSEFSFIFCGMSLQYLVHHIYDHTSLNVSWGRVTHICVSKLTTIGSDNGLSPGRRQAIIWANAEILLIGPLGINFNEILIKINSVSFTEMHLKISSAKWCLFRLGLNQLITTINCIPHMLPVYQSHVLHCLIPLQYHSAHFIINYCDFVYFVYISQKVKAWYDCHFDLHE